MSTTSVTPTGGRDLWSKNLISTLATEWGDKAADITCEVKTGQGKKSSTEIQAMDTRFMAEITSTLDAKIANFSDMPDEKEEDLMNYCRERSSLTTE